MPTVTKYTDADINRLFKKEYAPWSSNVFATYDAILSQFAIEVGTFGEEIQQTFDISLGGSVGAGGSSLGGILPLSNNAETVRIVAGPHQHYARCIFDNLSVENAKSKGKGAVVSLLDYITKQKIASFNRNEARNFFNDSTGVLGQFSGSAGGTATNPTMTILNTGRYRRRALHFEPKDYVNVGLGAAAPPFATAPLSSVFQIDSYNASTGLLTLSRVSGSTDLTTIGAGTWNVYMQNSWNADKTGILNMCFDTSFYGVSSRYRFQPFVLPGTTDSDVLGANIDTDMITSMYDNYSALSEQSFTHIVLPPVQFRKYKSLLESQKRAMYEVQMKAIPSGIGDDKMIAKVGYSAIKFYGAESSCVVMQHRLLRDDMVLFLNKNHIKRRFIMEPQWQDRDGTTFLRVEGLDQYEARYAAYGEWLINPYHIGFIQGLNTTEL